MDRTFIITIKDKNIDCNEIKKPTKSEEYIIDDTDKCIMKKPNFSEFVERIIFPLMYFAYIHWHFLWDYFHYF